MMSCLTTPVNTSSSSLYLFSTLHPCHTSHFLSLIMHSLVTATTHTISAGFLHFYQRPFTTYLHKLIICVCVTFVLVSVAVNHALPNPERTNLIASQSSCDKWIMWPNESCDYESCNNESCDNGSWDIESCNATMNHVTNWIMCQQMTINHVTQCKG